MFELYKALMTERENDGDRLWVLFGLMNVINGALLTYVTTKDLNPLVSKVVIGFLGLIISILWLEASIRMSAWIQWWEVKLQELEAHAFDELRKKGHEHIPENFKVFVDRKLDRNRGLSTKWISQSIPVFFICAWVFLLLALGQR